MRGLYFCLLFVFNCIIAFAQDYNETQNAFRTDAAKYLNSEGFSVEYQDDGLKLKSEDVVYYLEISKEDIRPLYVRFRRYVKYDNSLTKAKAIENLNDFNVKYGVKAFCLENAIVLSTEAYVKDISAFEYIFGDMYRQTKSAYELLTE